MHLVLFLSVDSHWCCGWRPIVIDGNGFAVIEIVFVQSVFRDTESNRWSSTMLHAIGCSLLLFLRNRTKYVVNIRMYCLRRFSINSVGCEYVTLFKLQLN